MSDAITNEMIVVPTRRRAPIFRWPSPVLVLASQPNTFATATLLVGGILMLAMCLYTVVTDDWPCAAVAGFGILVAGVASAQSAVSSLVLFGVVAGVPMVVLGVVHVLQDGRRV